MAWPLQTPASSIQAPDDTEFAAHAGQYSPFPQVLELQPGTPKPPGSSTEGAQARKWPGAAATTVSLHAAMPPDGL